MSEAADRLQTDSQFGRKTRSEALGPSARDAPRSCKKRSTHSRRAYILHPVCNCVCSLCSSCIYKVQRQSWKGTRSSSNPAARAFARPPSSCARPAPHSTTP